MFRRVLTICAAAVVATVALAVPASASQPIPQSPYCFTVDGSGVCLIVTNTIDHRPDTLNGDYTAADTVTVGFYCPGTSTVSALCAAIGAIAPISIRRTGVVSRPSTIGTLHVTTVRVPQICTPLGCNGPTFVDVNVPWVYTDVEVWVLGGNPFDQICIGC
jgi:hypothetical protein